MKNRNLMCFALVCLLMISLPIVAFAELKSISALT